MAVSASRAAERCRLVPDVAGDVHLEPLTVERRHQLGLDP